MHKHSVDMGGNWLKLAEYTPPMGGEWDNPFVLRVDQQVRFWFWCEIVCEYVWLGLHLQPEDMPP